MFTATTIRPEEITYAWLGAIVKSERDAEGNVLVYGKVTDGTIDSDDQIVDPAFAKKALAEWYETAANVRQMHATTLPPAGKGILLDSRPDGEYVQTKVVEPTAKVLVENDVYTGYSVGIARPRIERDPRARGGRIVGGKIVEISLVDRPANPMAKFAVLKAAGIGGKLKFVGKVVLLDGQAEEDEEGEQAVKIRRGMHVTAHVRDGSGFLTSVEGRVTTKSKVGFALDTTGFDDFPTVVSIARQDVEAVYKGSVPLEITKAARPVTKAASVVHTHPHIDPATGLQHEHEHRHAPNHGDHSQSHDHGHPSTEDSVADEDIQQTDGGAADAQKADAQKGVKCSKCGAVKGHKKGCTAAEPEVTKDGGDCSACGGSGQKDGAQCSACGGTGSVAAKAADPAPDADGDSNGDADADDAPAASDGAADDGKKPFPGAKKPFGKKVKVARFRVEKREDGTAFDLFDKKTVIGSYATTETADAALKTAKAEAKKVARVKKVARAEARKAAKALKAQKQAEEDDAIPWLVRRAHDFTCAAYDTDSIKEAYPAIEKNGVAAAVGPAARQSIYTMLANEVKEDGGTGASADGIYYLGKALHALEEFLEYEGATPDAMIAARDDLNGAFKAENPDVGSLPKPSESINPGQFRRPYLSEGHQRETGGNPPPTIPQTTHPISADQFSRGPLTEGHQRYLVSKMAEFHDALSSWKPELCLMRSMTSEGRFDTERQPAYSDRRGEELGAQVSNQQNASPTPRYLPATSPAPGEKTVRPENNIASALDLDAGTVATQVTAQQFAAAMAKIEEVQTDYIALKAQYDQLAASADPNRAPNRGVTGVVTKGARVQKLATTGSRKGSRKRDARIEAWRDMAASSDAAMRIYAQDRLRRKGVDL